MDNCTVIDCEQQISSSSLNLSSYFGPGVTPDPDITGVGVRLLLVHNDSLEMPFMV